MWIILITQGNSNIKEELFQQLQTFSYLGLLRKAQVIQSVMEDSVVFNGATKLACDRIIDLKDEFESKDTELTEIHEPIRTET